MITAKATTDTMGFTRPWGYDADITAKESRAHGIWDATIKTEQAALGSLFGGKYDFAAHTLHKSGVPLTAIVNIGQKGRVKEISFNSVVIRIHAGCTYSKTI